MTEQNVKATQPELTDEGFEVMEAPKRDRRKGVILKLITPILDEDKSEVTQLRIPRPLFEHLEKFNKEDQMNSTREVISDLTGIPAPCLRKLDVEDLMRAAEVLSDFFGTLEKGGSGEQPK